MIESQTCPRPFPWQPMLLVSVLLAGGGMVWRMNHLAQVSNEEKFSSQIKAVPEPEPAAAEPRPVEKQASRVSNAALMPPEARAEYDKACEMLKRVLVAGKMSDWEACVRHPEITMPRLRMENGRWRILPEMPLRISPQFAITEKLLITTVRLRDGSYRHAAFEKQPEGYKLDWESLTAWCELRLEEISANTVPVPVLVRVNTQPASAMPPFSHEGGVSIMLSHPAERRVVNAHVPEKAMKASKHGEALRSQPEGQFTLRVKAHTGSAQHGWLVVDEVICSGWITDK